MLFALALGAAGVAAAPAAQPGLEQLEHIVLFMQENRAFTHYYGTMAGVRGFKDPQVAISASSGNDVWHQAVNSAVTPKPPAGVTEVLPFWINAAGGTAINSTQCMVAGSNGWVANHAAFNFGSTDRWALNNTAYSMGYYKRQDIPFHFELAESFTIGDAYHESVIAATDPNRVSWMSGSVNIPGGKQTPAQGGPVLDNNANDGCETGPGGAEFSCFPYDWKTLPEYLQDAGIDWQVYQDVDNFGDDPLPLFTQWENISPNSTLAERGLAFIGIDRFVSDAGNGTLPSVSIIVGQEDLSEHPPFGPTDGAWLQRKIVEAVLTSPKYANTALIISYDETGGWADSTMAPHAPEGTPGEWIEDPMTPSNGLVPAGPGFRVPLVIVSPFTRNGGVFTEVGSHESQIMFLEQWSSVVGKPFMSAQINDWRREQMSDLVSAFDFAHPDTSIPNLPVIRMPTQDPNTGMFNGGATCQAAFPNPQPAVPYGNQTTATALATESGSKAMRGRPWQGHLVVLEQSGKALSFAKGQASLESTKAAADHSPADQRFVFFAVDLTMPAQGVYNLATSESPARWLAANLKLVSSRGGAGNFSVTDLGNGQGHAVVEQKSGEGLTIGSKGPELAKTGSDAFALFSVTF